VRRRLHRYRPCLQASPGHRSSPKKVGQSNNLFGLANFAVGACTRHAPERVVSTPRGSPLTAQWTDLKAGVKDGIERVKSLFS
jgi:hypothetical protein